MPDLKGSPALSLSKHDAWKVLKGALIAAAGAALTYLAEWVSGADFGAYTPAVVAIAGVLVNLARKWLMDTSTLALFLAFVLGATACQAACRHITPMPERYPATGETIVTTLDSELDNFWSKVPCVQAYGVVWPCENNSGQCWSSGDKALATFDRRRHAWVVERAWRPVPVLFDPATGRRLP